MTREQAIAHGKSQLEVFGGEHREFIELAVKALEQEPTTKEEAYNKGYADGVKSVNICPHCGEYIGEEE